MISQAMQAPPEARQPWSPLQARPSSKPAQPQWVVQRAAAARRWTALGSSGSSGSGGRRRRLALPPAASQQQQADASSSSSSSSGGVATALAGLRYTSPCGAFAVRPMRKDDADEVRRVVALQSEAFHTPARLAALDGMARRFFEAEVLSEMSKKLRFNPEDMFASLVIEPTDPSTAMADGGSSGSNHVIGGVEVSFIANADTLRLLEPGTQGYCYVASMVVAPGWRRRGAARALLAAAEAAVAAWDERQAVLQVYQDNAPAVQLYESQGYEVIGGKQGGKMGLLGGGRPRYTMRKRW